jgi:hypothetical protein
MDNSTFNQMWLIWLLSILAAIFSFSCMVLIYKIIKKLDDFQIATFESLQILNNERVKTIKEIEILKRRSRMISNETKENIRRKD